MKNTVILGAQWGDEGKGKIVDLLAENYDAIVRFQGGNNAGHTLVIEDKVYKLHLVPSGILYPGKKCILGNGMVIDPQVLLQEIEALQERGVDCKNLFISDRAHVIMPYHKVWETLEENLRGKQKIGTTKRGIGPCYADKITRIGIRMLDLVNPEVLKQKLSDIVPFKKQLIQAFGGENDSISENEIYESYSNYGKALQERIVDTSALLEKIDASGGRILFEGAQGMFLGIDHGTYPFVTSSNTVASQASIGAGVSMKKIHKVMGVIKAYTTRVGGGPFPTEIEGGVGEELRKAGKEFGTTTGRPRRCGWLDLEMLKYVHRLNGLDAVVLTKLDVLKGIHPIKVCLGYEYQGQRLESYPSDTRILDSVNPIYEELDGWEEDISRCLSFADLPLNCKKYVQRIEEFSGVPVEIISVGPERDRTIFREL